MITVTAQALRKKWAASSIHELLGDGGRKTAGMVERMRTVELL